MAERPASFSEANKKSEVSELKKMLQSSEVLRDSSELRKVVQRVIACMTLGMDVSSLFTDMIKASATHNLVQKKLIYLYICSYAESNPDLALLTVNTLKKDAQDSSAMVRGLALRSMCSLRLPDLVEYIEEPLVKGLEDNNSYVRRTAVMGCIKLFHLTPDIVDELGLLQRIQNLLNDPDPQVVCNSISALDEILASQGGMLVDQKTARHLLKRLKSFSEWGQSQILGLLHRYTPEDEEELLDFMNAIDDRLKHPNGAVVMASVSLFLFLTQDMEQFREDVFERVKGPLLSIVCCGNSELSYTSLCHIELLLDKSPHLYDQDYKTFFARFNDPSYIKSKKLKILLSIATQSTVEDIISELSANVHEVDASLAEESIKAIGQIAMSLPQTAEFCIDTLLTFLSWEIEYITAQTLIVVRDLLLRYEKCTQAVLPQLQDCLELVQDSRGRAAIMWMTGQYGEHIPDSPYMLESVIDHIKEEHSSDVKLQLLTATMKLFFKRPAECQEMLGRLLQYCVDEEEHMDVRDRAMMYYRLLKEGVKQARNQGFSWEGACLNNQDQITKIINAECPTNLRTAEKAVCCTGTDHKWRTRSSEHKPTKEHLFKEFNTLSIIYGQPSTNFISQTIPYIKGRPFTEEEDSDTEENLTPQVDGRNPSSRAPDGPQEVVVGDLLGGNLDADAVEDEAEIGIQLNPQAALSPALFEQKWKSLPQRLSLQIQLNAVPESCEELQQTMRSCNIVLMASGTAQQTLQKYFFYAQKVPEDEFYLMETVIDTSTGSLKAVIKADENSDVTPFHEHFRQSLLGKWLALE